MGNKFGADDAFMRKLHKELFPPGTHPDPPEFPHAREAIAVDKPLKDKTVAAKKKKPKKPPARQPTPEPDDEIVEVERVCGPRGGKNFASTSLRLQGKDELLIIDCATCKATHYYLGQPVQGSEEFRVIELLGGEEVWSGPRTPSGDLDTETAMEELEEAVEEH